MTRLSQSQLIWEPFFPAPHCSTLLRDLEMLCTERTVTESLFCDLKWLLLSSRLQELCCPRSWSLRFKMRLPQCCESATTEGKKTKERNLQYSTQLLWHVQGHLFYSYYCNIWACDILNMWLPTGIQVWCTLMYYLQSIICQVYILLTGFEHWRQDFISLNVKSLLIELS